MTYLSCCIIAFLAFCLGVILTALFTWSKICDLEETVAFWQRKHRELLKHVPDEKIMKMKVGKG